MASIGEFLKTVRTEKKISKKQVSEDTRIKERIIDNIEADNFGELNGLGYVKAMIFSYGRYLGIEDEEIKKKFYQQFANQMNSNRINRRDNHRTILLSANFFYLILLVIVTIAFALFIYHNYKSGNIKLPFRQNYLEKKVEPKQQKQEIEKSDKKEKKQTNPKPKEKTKTEEITINKEALKDSTDYLEKFLFKEKSHPFHYNK